jgi:hypothetical protein
MVEDTIKLREAKELIKMVRFLWQAHIQGFELSIQFDNDAPIVSADRCIVTMASLICIGNQYGTQQFGVLGKDSSDEYYVFTVDEAYDADYILDNLSPKIGYKAYKCR